MLAPTASALEENIPAWVDGRLAPVGKMEPVITSRQLWDSGSDCTSSPARALPKILNLWQAEGSPWESATAMPSIITRS